MELNVNPKGEKLFGGLGISEERGNQLVDSARDWLKDQMRNASGGELDKLDFIKHCASLSETLEEYTILVMNVDTIIEQAIKELHEEVCPRCKARKEAQQRRERGEEGRGRGFGFGFGRAGFGGPGIEQVAPGVFVINL